MTNDELRKRAEEGIICRDTERYIEAAKDEQSVALFWSNVEKTDGCWLWKRWLNFGYGTHHFKRKRLRAHRFSFVLRFGSVDPYKVIDHICRVRNCVRPDHLREISSKENILAGISLSAQFSKKTKCPRGHDYTHVNKYGSRECRICRVIVQRLVRAANPEKARKRVRDYRLFRKNSGNPLPKYPSKPRNKIFWLFYQPTNQRRRCER